MSDLFPGEQTLVEQARRDPRAFGRLFDRYHDDILNYILHRTANVHLAQELTSNTFFKALKKLWQFRWRGAPFSAWLYRIASNEVNEYFRLNKRFPAVEIESVHERLDDPGLASDREIIEAEAQVMQNAAFLELHAAISRLKPRYQEVVVLKYFENKKISEIGCITRKSEGTIKSLLHRALKKLRAELETTGALQDIKIQFQPN